MNKSGPPTRLAPSEYEAIEQAMMETERGRWFLSQYAEKNRRKDTQVVLEAISKLESTVSTTRSQPEADRIKMDLVEMSKAISRTRNEIANLKLPEHDGGNLLDATEELDSIVSTTERATTKILQAAEDIQETAWTIREDGSFEAPCARIDTDVTDIYTACSFQDITGQRTQKVVHVLRYLEARINAMVSIWGLDKEDFANAGRESGENVQDRRPDAHLLNGPQLDRNALKQDDIDGVMDGIETRTTTITKNENQTEIDITAKFIAQTATEVEALTIQAVEVAEELILAAETEAKLLDEEYIDIEISSEVLETTPEDTLSGNINSAEEKPEEITSTKDNLEENITEELPGISDEPVATELKPEETEAELPDSDQDLTPTETFKDIETSPELSEIPEVSLTSNIEDLTSEAEDLTKTESSASEPLSLEMELQPEIISSIDDNKIEHPVSTEEIAPEYTQEDSVPDNVEAPEETAELATEEADVTAEDIAELSEDNIDLEDNKPLIDVAVEDSDTILQALAEELDAIQDITEESAEAEEEHSTGALDTEETVSSADEEINNPDQITEDADSHAEFMEQTSVESQDTPPPLPGEGDNDAEIISREQETFVKHFAKIQKELQAAKRTDTADQNEEESKQQDQTLSKPEMETSAAEMPENDTEVISTETVSEPNAEDELTSATESGYQTSDWVGQNLYLLLEEEEGEQSAEEETMSNQLRNLPGSAKTAAFE